MKKIRKILLTYLLWNKRLLKKPAFIAVIILIPLLVFSMSVAGKEESGVVSVALARTDNSDTLSLEVINSLTKSSGLVKFTVCDTPDDAASLVKNGKADAAWIFPSDLKGKIASFTETMNSRRAFVTVIEREETLVLQMAREKLYAAIYPYTSRALCIGFIRKDVAGLDLMSDETIMEYYDSVKSQGDDLFGFIYENGRKADTGYLTYPLRGLLSVLTVVGGLAVTMFYMKDEKKGVFAHVPFGKRPIIAFLYHLTAVADIAVISLIALIISGLSVSFFHELLLTVLFSLITVGFCMTVSGFFRSIRVTGALIPVISIAMAVLCPVFFDIPG
ncbi:MAG: ABC transporter permease, partial [Eubacteriales bacterium]